MGKFLKFKAEKDVLGKDGEVVKKGRRYHNGREGLIRDGEVKEYPDAVADQLLLDHPHCFEVVSASEAKKEKLGQSETKAK